MSRNDVITRANIYNCAGKVVFFSNRITITSFERAFQAQHNALCPARIGHTEWKLRPFKILNIYALVHYTK